MKHQPHHLSLPQPLHTPYSSPFSKKRPSWPPGLGMGCSFYSDCLPPTSAGKILVHSQDSSPDGPSWSVWYSVMAWGSRVRKPGCLSWVFQLTGCVTLGRSHYLSGPQAPARKKKKWDCWVVLDYSESTYLSALTGGGVVKNKGSGMGLAMIPSWVCI